MLSHLVGGRGAIAEPRFSPHLTVTLSDRTTTAGKYFRVGANKWYLKGFSYGPFAPNHDGEYFPPRAQLLSDFAHMRALGANCIRVYTPPPRWLLDEALDQGLRVFVDVPWEKHRCFFEDWDAQVRARHAVKDAAQRLGDHPGLFAISVANEIPADIIRFYGNHRVERFINELVHTVKENAPDCLATYVNYPTAEFLNPSNVDFYCYNVYVHNEQKLGKYLDRLQHIAGNKPLVLGEYGIDTLREGELEQANLLKCHLKQVFSHGLAGSFVFAYTDDWFTGGHQIEDWAFGVTDRERNNKPSAIAVRECWKRAPYCDSPQPKISVVVCSYNGAATLRECLTSLSNVDYPDFEVILVDDGSTDDTRTIADDFPQVIYYYQPNKGLSVARNVGAELATGEIIAYTDSDCVVDEYWLRYLADAMEAQQVVAIGGPNITPESDGWTAKCVAASPGNPSHVMLDDRYAEHVPGCNLAIRREVLLGLGGFDAQFRQAGDDVDLCWRLLDANLSIGYAPGAMVWHHRRATVKAYAKQQKGYGRSEAMLHFKHRRRCGTFGRSSWRGIIYGDGAVGLPLIPETVYHGQFGLAPFQTIYRHNHYGVWSCMMSLEWHVLALGMLVLALLFWPCAIVSGAMWSATFVLCIRSAMRAPLPAKSPWWCRWLVGYLYFLQPIVRGWHRQTYTLRCTRMPRIPAGLEKLRPTAKHISSTEWDLYWQSADNLGREQLLPAIVEEAQRWRWLGNFDDAWSSVDVQLLGNACYHLRIRTATEELGWPRRFTRARCHLQSTFFSRAVTVALLTFTLAAVASLHFWEISIGLAGYFAMAIWRWISRRRILRRAALLVTRAGIEAGLECVSDHGEVTDVGPLLQDAMRARARPAHDAEHDEDVVSV